MGGGGGGGRLFEAGPLLTFSAFRIGANSKWALIQGWALIGINTVTFFELFGLMHSPFMVITILIYRFS